MPDYKEYIYAVSTEHSFSRAAEKLHVSQPWLSSAVKRVEQELGSPIFDRSTNPISLTAEGRFYIGKIKEIMSIEGEIKQYFAQVQDRGTTLRIGSSMFFCTYVLPGILANFRGLYPYVTVTLTEGNSAMMTELLLSNSLDLVLEAEQLDNPKLENTSWISEELILAVPASFEINRKLEASKYTFDEFLNRQEKGYRQPVSLSEFSSEEFMMLQEGNDSYTRGLQMCKNAGFSPKVSYYLTQMMTAYYLVCERRGIAIIRTTIPEHVTPTKDVVFYQIQDPLATRSVYLSWLKKGMTPLRQKLIDFLLN